MFEWRTLLEQTHPGFQTTDSNKTDSGVEEIEWISPINKLQNQIENIPPRLGFKIGEVADYVGVRQHVLRYWESEFDTFHPKKAKNGQRLYTKKDIETALIIKKLLHGDRFSTEGARSALKKLRQQMKQSIKEKENDLKKERIKTRIQNNLHSEERKQPGDSMVSGVKNSFGAEESLESARNLLNSIRQTRESLDL